MSDTIEQLTEELLATQDKLLEYKTKYEELAQSLPYRGKIETLEKESDKEDTLIVKGIALKPGKWNFYYYAKEALKKGAKTLKGKPIVVDHGKKVRDIVGKITDAWWDDRENAVLFKGEIYDKEIARLIKEGLVHWTSTGANFEPIETSHGPTVSNLEFYELALTLNPAFHNGIKKVEENIKIESSVNREDNMTKEELEEERKVVLPISRQIAEENDLKIIKEELEGDKEQVLAVVDKESLEEEEERGEKYYYPKYYKKYPYYKYYPRYRPSPYYYKYRGVYYPYYAPYYKEGYPSYYEQYPYYGYPYYGRPYKYPYRYSEQDSMRESMEVLEEIIAAVDTNEELQFTCPVCGKKFDTWRDFFVHWNKEHREKYGLFKKKYGELEELEAKSEEKKEGESKEEKKVEEKESKTESEEKTEESKIIKETIEKLEKRQEELYNLVKELKEGLEKAEESKESEKKESEEKTEEREEKKEETETKEESESAEEKGEEKRVKEEEVVEPKRELDVKNKSFADLVIMREQLRQKELGNL